MNHFKKSISCGIKKRKLTIINHRGKYCQTGFFMSNSTSSTICNRMFSTKESPMPNTITVEEMNPSGKKEAYLVSQVNSRQTLQINATRIKNNEFLIPVKLRYFAHHF
jgi:hypothetical protein